MKIAVCIKRLPSTNEVNMDPVTNTIIRDSRQSVTNLDTYALEQAVQLKEAGGRGGGDQHGDPWDGEASS